MKQLPLEFEGRGKTRELHYKMTHRTDNAYMYEVTSNEDTKHYEVFKHKEYTAHPPFVREDMVAYPSDEAFGNWAWTFNDKIKAYDKMLSL